MRKVAREVLEKASIDVNTLSKKTAAGGGGVEFTTFYYDTTLRVAAIDARTLLSLTGTARRGEGFPS